MGRYFRFHRQAQDRLWLPPGVGSLIVNPNTLNLTGLWEGAYAGSPWNGIASAGSSSGKNLTEATNPPGTVAVNGINVALFDGTNDILTGGTYTNFYNVANYAGFALVRVLAVSTNSGSSFLNNAVFSFAGGQHELFMRNNAGAYTVGINHFNGAVATERTTSFSIATDMLCHWKFDGTNVTFGLNGSWGASAATGGNLQAAAGNMNLGRNYNGTIFTNLRVLALGFTNDYTVINNNISGIKAYYNNKYNLSL